MFQKGVYLTEHKLDLDKLVADRNGHSVFGPSGSAMWSTCAGSLIPNLLAPDETSFEAAEGTVAHAIAEEWLKTGIKPKHHLGTTQIVEENGLRFEIVIDVIMFDYIKSYVDWVRFLPGQHYVERRVDFSRLMPIPKQTGTADFIALEHGKMWIRDLKYGAGVYVEVENNTQALLYALGAFYEYDEIYDIQEIDIGIGQPRMDNFSTWTISREELLSWEPYFRETAAAAWKVNAPRHPSVKGCRWCKVKATCGAQAKLQEELAMLAFDDLAEDKTEKDIEALKNRITDDLEPYKLEFVSPSDLTVEQMAILVPYRRLAEMWWKSIEDELEKRLQEGAKVPGYKLVDGRKSRDFINEKKAAEELEWLGLEPGEIFERKMISPAEAEKRLRKKGYRMADMPSLLKKIVYAKPGKPTMAPENDKREAVQDVAGDAFESMDDDL